MTVIDDRICRKVREVIQRIQDQLIVGSNIAWEALVGSAVRAQLEPREINTGWGLSVLRSKKMAVDPEADALQRRIDAKQSREQAARRAVQVKAELARLTGTPSSRDEDVVRVLQLRRELSELEAQP